jgi:hypothetical protein
VVFLVSWISLIFADLRCSGVHVPYAGVRLRPFVWFSFVCMLFKNFNYRSY